MRLAYLGEWDHTGLGMATLLDLDSQQRDLVTWLMRQGPSCIEDLCDCLGIDPASASELINLLEDEGLICEIEKDGRIYYQVFFGSRRVRTGSEKIWQALDMNGPAKDDNRDAGTGVTQVQDLTGSSGLLNRWLSSKGVQMAVSLSPVLAVFLLAEWSVINDSSSFSEVVGVLGALTMPLLAGIFPVLLLVAARRKGERLPEKVYHFLENPLLLGFIYLLTLASLFLHGLLIWQAFVPRLLAVIAGVFSLAITVSIIRKGAFARRRVIELRSDPAQPGLFEFNSLVCGRPAPLQVSWQANGNQPVLTASAKLPVQAGLQTITFQVPAEPVDELAIWVHRVTAEADSENLSGTVEMDAGVQAHKIDLPLSGGPLILPHDGIGGRLTVFLDQTY